MGVVSFQGICGAVSWGGAVYGEFDMWGCVSWQRVDGGTCGWFLGGHTPGGAGQDAGPRSPALPPQRGPRLPRQQEGKKPKASGGASFPRRSAAAALERQPRALQPSSCTSSGHLVHFWDPLGSTYG